MGFAENFIAGHQAASAERDRKEKLALEHAQQEIQRQNAVALADYHKSLAGVANAHAKSYELGPLSKMIASNEVTMAEEGEPGAFQVGDGPWLRKRTPQELAMIKFPPVDLQGQGQAVGLPGVETADSRLLSAAQKATTAGASDTSRERVANTGANARVTAARVTAAGLPGAMGVVPVPGGPATPAPTLSPAAPPPAAPPGAAPTTTPTTTPAPVKTPLPPAFTQYHKVSSTGHEYLDLGALKGKLSEAAILAAGQANIPVLDTTDREAMKEIEAARLNSRSMMETIAPFLPKDASGRIIAAPTNRLSAYLQTEPALKAYNAWRGAAIKQLRAMAGSKNLRINQAEIQLALDNDIPEITDTLGTAQEKMAVVNKILDNNETAIFGTLAGAGAKATGGAGKQSPKVQKNSKGEYRYSLDGGTTWTPGQPPSQ